MDKVLKASSKAPDFTLKDKDGVDHNLCGIDTDYVVLFFYPKDNTPGCTIEAQSFTKDRQKFQNLSATLCGISGGNEKSKTKFCEKYDLKTLMLSDSDFSIANQYGVYGEKSFMGEKYMGITRTTFVLGKNNKIIKVFDQVKPKTHSEEVLNFLASVRH